MKGSFIADTLGCSRFKPEIRDFSWFLGIGVLPLTKSVLKLNKPIVGSCFYRFCGGRKHYVYGGCLHMRVYIDIFQVDGPHAWPKGNSGKMIPNQKSEMNNYVAITWKGIEGGTCNFKASDLDSYSTGGQSVNHPKVALHASYSSKEVDTVTYICFCFCRFFTCIKGTGNLIENILDIQE